MKKRYIGNISKAVLSAAFTVAFSACSDTIDEHYQAADGVATKTLWEQLSAQPDLKNFASILEKVHYYNAEGKPSNLTYKDILSANNKLTVWAPEDGTYDYQALLDELQNDEYNVEYRFIRNHVNTFSRGVGGSELDSITMLNSKLGVLDNAEKKFKGVNILVSNIPATNGLLHKLEHQVDFQENLYEFMQTSPEVSNLFQFFHERDTTYIDEYQSVQGGIQDGEITYADTVWTTRSKAFDYSYSFRGEDWNGLNANLKDEDSSFVMIMPTNLGWEKALAKTKAYYQYMTLPYENLDDENKPQTVNPDTLQKNQSLMSIVNRLVFSPNQQRYYTLEDFGHTDSLFTTRSEVIDTPYCNDIFRGIEPIPLSNGYAYLTDDYLYNVSEDIEVEAENTYYWNGIPTSTNRNTGSVNKSNRNPKISGSVSGNGYAYAVGTASKVAASMEFKLPNVLSGKYDIYAIMVPENIADTLKQNVRPSKFKATLWYYDGKSTQLEDEDSEDFVADTLKVDTVLLFKDFKFPIAYKGVTGAFPKLTFVVSSKWQQWELGTNEYANKIYIDKIILKAKDEE